MTSELERAATTVILFAALLTTGLSAGFFYGWQVGAIPGLGVVDAATYVRAMNGVNAEIRNTGFAAIFFGSAALMLLTLVLGARRRRTAGFAPTAAALSVYLVGTVMLTFIVHVPMNEALLERTDLSVIDVAAVRDAYQTRWNAWHLVRTAAAVLSFALLLLAAFREWNSVAAER